jgi:hypothetical protein
MAKLISSHSTDPKIDETSSSIIIEDLKNCVLITFPITNHPSSNIKSKEKACLGQQLLKAVEKGFLDDVKLLLLKGADSNSKDPNGNTAFTLAQIHNHPEIYATLDYWKNTLTDYTNSYK